MAAQILAIYRSSIPENEKINGGQLHLVQPTTKHNIFELASKKVNEFEYHVELVDMIWFKLAPHLTSFRLHNFRAVKEDRQVSGE